MPAENFHCPKCNWELKKSAQAYVLGESEQQKDAAFIGLGEIAKTVTCPGCGQAIDAQRMMLRLRHGLYYHRRLDRIDRLAGAVAICFYGEMPWWFGLIALLMIAGGVGRVYLVLSVQSRVAWPGSRLAGLGARGVVGHPRK